jgi:exodeoxyribonuclease VIII
MESATKQNVNVMIDIETLGIGEDAVVLSIGAVKMDMETLVVNDVDAFYIELDPNQPGRVADPDTISWWMRVGGCPNQGTTLLPQALKDLSNFIPSGAKIWCKGTDFDTRILSHAYKRASIPVPWKYHDVRDCRTIFKTFPLPDLQGNPKLHNALEDAKHQAVQLLETLKGLQK